MKMGIVARVLLFIFTMSFSVMANELWSHIGPMAVLEQEGITSSFIPTNGTHVLRLTKTDKTPYAKVSLPAPSEGWNLGRARTVESEIINTGTTPVNVILWVVPDQGWNAVGKSETIAAGGRQLLKCDLRTSFSDKTPKLNPARIQAIEVMLTKASIGSSIEVTRLTSQGSADKWVMPAGRIEVPNMERALPAAGKRVRYPLKDETANRYCALYLPESWTPTGSYPVIVEFPGNLYYTQHCYSTGRPEQCAIGMGMNRAVESIWISMPFVDYAQRGIAPSGWGNADDTADYTVRMVREIIQHFGGDAANVVLTGFSRGAIACGYIGRRNAEIASLWKGFHACQHYDGDGWGGATLAGAKERAHRIGPRPIFQTDNSAEPMVTMLNEVGAKVTYATSGLGAHATAMFLDERPSTIQLQNWYRKLVSNPMPIK